MMASSSKTPRDCSRSSKCSILLNNVLGITFAPCSIEVDQNDVNANNAKPQQSSTGKKLFDAFIDSNMSTLHTRLNESLSEIRLAGWIQPYTILVKGPQEEMDVLIEAWRRRFLRSPGDYAIREIGIIKSIDTEIIQQAPFLPLTKAVYEAIAALNSNSLPCGQKEVFEYLAHTYQYVHVPKPNVIRDCLGILFKEGKVYVTQDNQYFVYVHSESDDTDGEKKTHKTPIVTEKLQEKVHPQCSLFDEEKGSGSEHARNKQSNRQVDRAHLCEKHKHAQKSGRKSRESNQSLDTSMESKEIKNEKKDKKSSSVNNRDLKKAKDKTKKTVWGQLAGFMKGKTHDSTKENSSKAMTSDKKVKEAISDTRPTRTAGATTTFDDPFKEDDERMTPLGASLNEKQIEHSFQRSRSFNIHTKKRPELARSNSFTSNSTKKKAIDYDIESQKNENTRAALNYNPKTIRPSNSSIDQSFTVGKTVRPSTSSADQSFTTSKIVQRTPEPMGQRNNPCAVGVVRPYTQISRTDGRNVSRYNSLKDTRMMNSTSSTPTNDLQRSIYRPDSKQFGSVTPTNSEVLRVRPGSKDFTRLTPTGDIHRSVSRDSNRLSSGTLTNDLQRSRDSKTSTSTLTSGMYTPVFRDTKIMGSLTSSDFDRPVMRDPRNVTRSLSLKEHRYSDTTPYSSHRKHVNVEREFLNSDSPLKHLLTKNTGNTLPVMSNRPSCIPGPTIQDRSRPSAQNRNSFPNTTLLQRSSWRTMSKVYHDDDDIGATAKGLLIDDNLKKHDHLFSPIYMQQNQRMLPCDCSETGCSENSCSKVLSDSTEQKSVSSENYQSSFLKKNNNENTSSACSTSENGILLDEISSTCSSEVQSIMNHEKKLHHTQQSPYTVAKGEVVLDSSLTFIGII